MLAASLSWTLGLSDQCFRLMAAQAAAAQSPPQTLGAPHGGVCQPMGPAAEVADTALASRRQR